MPVTVVGLGSRVAADDAIGLELAAAARGRPGVAVLLWEDRDALDLTGALLELDGPVLLLDCADMGLPPGSHRAFAASEARLVPHAAGASTHGFGVADALALAEALGFDAPVRILGVQPFDLRPGVTALSAPLQARWPALLAALDAELARLAPEPALGPAPSAPVAAPGGEPAPGGGASGAVTTTLRGVVQGVGMRPTLARLATAAGLGGAVLNRAGAVTLRLEGPAAAIDAFLASLPFVRIIHGKGTGALRQSIREFLSRHPLVSGYEGSKDTHGGEGVTIARLRQE